MGIRTAATLVLLTIPPLIAWAAGVDAAPAPPRQPPTVDTLMTRLFGSEDKSPYDLTADFAGTLTLTTRTGRFTAVAEGSFHEYRRADGVRRRKVTITRLDLPLLLRPFRGHLRRLIEEKIETQSETPETFHEHDIFIEGELPGHRYILIGVHKAVVDDAIDRYGKPEQKAHVETRRQIAKWLYTSPSMRNQIIRKGPPYALRTILDEAGTLYELTLFYDWGEIGTRIVYTNVQEQLVWQRVSSDAVSDLSGVGRVEGTLLLTFSKHCFNCKP